MCLHYESIFLIDEPENSLYPSEQIKLINFFIENSQKRTRNHQFFIATHSPFILKNFLNRNDVVIINVETGENILKSEKKKLLLNENNNVSYDEISYLYYDIPTPNYYNSLYEKLK
ncbi:ATP-binding protein [bacterium]|nr:ATP-binding protein [bacterium]